MKIVPHIRQCTNEACKFRFPVTEFDKGFEICPKCSGKTEFISKLLQHHHRKTDEKLPDFRVSFLLDNLRSIFNVGSIFRSADGCGVVDHLYLCGTTPTPEHHKMAKTALGAETVIPWTYHRNGLTLARYLLDEGHTLIALELTEASVPVKTFLQSPLPDKPVFIVGNEITGVDPEILDLCANKIHLPMQGIKESLNVAIAASILCYLI